MKRLFVVKCELLKLIHTQKTHWYPTAHNKDGNYSSQSHDVCSDQAGCTHSKGFGKVKGAICSPRWSVINMVYPCESGWVGQEEGLETAREKGRKDGRRREVSSSNRGKKGKMVQSVLSPSGLWTRGETWQDSWSKTDCLGFYGLSCVCTHPWMDLFSPQIDRVNKHTLTPAWQTNMGLSSEHLWVSDEGSSPLIKTMNLKCSSIHTGACKVKVPICSLQTTISKCICHVLQAVAFSTHLSLPSFLVLATWLISKAVSFLATRYCQV